MHNWHTGIMFGCHVEPYGSYPKNVWCNKRIISVDDDTIETTPLGVLDLFSDTFLEHSREIILRLVGKLIG